MEAGELGVALGFFGGRLKILAMLDQLGAEARMARFFSTELPRGT
jgi:hypothetical protein